MGKSTADEDSGWGFIGITLASIEPLAKELQYAIANDEALKLRHFTMHEEIINLYSCFRSIQTQVASCAMCISPITHGW